MRESRRIFRFAVIGTLNALIIAAVIWLMMDELDIDYMLSNITAYVIAQTHNFIWCKHWIFPLDDKEKKSNTWRIVMLIRSLVFAHRILLPMCNAPIRRMNITKLSIKWKNN